MPYRILVVDDEPDIREIVSILLQKNGYETRVAQNGGEAVRLARQEGPFYLVIMDIMMPEMDGLEPAGRFGPLVWCPCCF